MRARILLLALLAAAIHAHGAVPKYEMFLVDPKDAISTTVTDKGSTENIDVVLSKQQAAALLSFTNANVGKPVMIGYVQRQTSMSTPVIKLVCFFLKAPITDGALHLNLPNPNRNPQIIDPRSLPSSNMT